MGKLKRAKQAEPKHRGKEKMVDPAPNPTKLATAAEKAMYDVGAKSYHCRTEDGGPPSSRIKPASICPRQWRRDEATAALRNAIGRGQVSIEWDDESFPRYVWVRDEGTLYEGRHTRGPHGSYHAYPIEEVDAPKGLEK